MSMIASIKVGYKVTLLYQLLTIFDIEGRYIRAYAEMKNQKIGCRGIDFCWKHHSLYAIKILKPIREGDEGKYAKVDGI